MIQIKGQKSWVFPTKKAFWDCKKREVQIADARAYLQSKLSED